MAPPPRSCRSPVILQGMGAGEEPTFLSCRLATICTTQIKVSLSDNAYRASDVLFPGTSPSKAEAAWKCWSYPLCFLAARRNPSPTVEHGASSRLTGSDPATPAFGELLPGAAPGQKRGAGSLTRAAKAAGSRAQRSAVVPQARSAGSALKALLAAGGTGSRRGASGSGAG